MQSQASFGWLCCANMPLVTFKTAPPVPDKSFPELPSRIQSIKEWPGLRPTLFRGFPKIQAFTADYSYDTLKIKYVSSSEKIYDLLIQFQHKIGFKNSYLVHLLKL